MSRKSSRDLFLLIKSLNKSEKGYIKKMSFQSQDKNTNFLKLFTAIDNQVVYNEDELLKKERYIKQLPRLKIYLYERILTALDSYYSKQNLNISLQKMLSRVYVLLSKGLYDQCIKQLYKAKELAVRHEKFTVLLEIYDLQRTLLIEKQQVSSISRIQQEEDNTMKQIHNLSFYKGRYEEISQLYLEIIYARTAEEANTLKKVVTHENFKHSREARSIQAKIIRHKTLCKYYAALDDRRKYLQHAKAALLLIEKHPHYITENVLQYVKVVNNYLASASENGQQPEFELYMKKLQQIPALYGGSQKSLLKPIIQLRLLVREYFHSRNQQNYQKALEHIHTLEKYLTENSGLVSPAHQVIFFYHVAYINFINGNTRKALFWTNKIMSTPSSPDRLFFHCFARMLNLVCYFENGDIESLKYRLPSTERFLIKHDKLYSFETILLRFFRNYLSQPDKTGAYLLFPVLEQELKKNFVPMERKILEYFDVFGWCRSKMLGQPLVEVLSRQS